MGEELNNSYITKELLKMYQDSLATTAGIIKDIENIKESIQEIKQSIKKINEDKKENNNFKLSFISIITSSLIVTLLTQFVL
ncbi:MAG: hypothetical protein IE890_04215 [Arcobacter sp.]|nr:hypothetical protein [Arcobacter sp.]